MQKKWGLYIFICCLLFSFPAFCQVNIDSLMQEFKTVEDDTSKVFLLLNIANQYETNQQDSAIYYLEMAHRLAESLKFKKGIYKYYEQRAIVSFTTGDYPAAMDQNNRALTLAQELGDSGLMVNILANTGIVYQYLGRFDTQLEYLLRALRIIEKREDDQKLSPIYHNIGNAYYNLNQYRKSLEYCFLALKTHGQYGGQMYVNRVIATIGGSYEQLKMRDSALYYYTQGVKESVKHKDKYAEATIYGYMANVYASSNDFVSMLQVSEKSLLLANELQSRQLLASSFYNMANAHYYNNHQVEAKRYIYDALKIAEKDSLSDELKNIYSILSYIAAQEGDYSTSRWARTKTDSIQEASLNKQVLRSTAELQEKYESEKRNDIISLQQLQLRQKQLFNYVLIVATVIILLIGFLLYRNYKHTQKLQRERISELETEKQLMATEAVLKGEEQERTRIAKDLHDGLGGLLSGIKYSLNNMKENLIMTPDNQQAFARSIDMLDSSIKEMRRVAHNMMPEALVKFGLDTALRDFCNDINQSGSLQVSYQSIGLKDIPLDQTIAINIYRIIQELINNTMKHAGAKTAIVQVTHTDKQIAITVEDDGRGFDTTLLTRSTGLGWGNIRSRVDFLKGKLDLKSDQEHGTSVHIDITV